ncbi:cold shock domain-containing protein [Nocardia takedensis]|uniref:cold shock domain-containing protein n=1 Tax=Nocardia takedensis TaxID=259390 RepID=UPI0003005F0F|nr:cold shock domain-containing protein [Nocardia takedensis]
MQVSDSENTVMSATSAPEWRRGIVSWFDGPKGFGFIQPAGAPQLPVFVEHSCIDAPGYRVLVEGQSVLFRHHVGSGRSRAAVVRPLPAGA